MDVWASNCSCITCTSAIRGSRSLKEAGADETIVVDCPRIRVFHHQVVLFSMMYQQPNLPVYA